MVPTATASHHHPGLVPAVARALTVMDLLARQRRPMNMAGLATALNLPRSSVHGLCSTLLSFGYLKRGDSGALQIGPGVMSLAEAFVASTNVASEFEALWRDGGAPEETLVLSVLSGTEVIYVGARNSARPLGLAFNIGMRLPAHLAATGQAQLDWLPAAELQALYPGGDAAPLPRLTAGGVASVGALVAELAQTRQRGYGIDDGGVRDGVYALAAPVFDAGGRAVASIAVCINKATLDAEQQARQCAVVRQAAAQLSARLGARSENP